MSGDGGRDEDGDDGDGDRGCPRAGTSGCPGGAGRSCASSPGRPGAPVLMLLHGWTATADLNWFACFRPLAEHFRVIAIDHRGHGRGLRSAEPFRLEQCADDVAALARRARHRTVRARRLLDGRSDRPADLAAPPPTSSTASCCPRRAPRSPAPSASGCCSVSPPARASSPTPCPSPRSRASPCPRWNDWRHRRGCPWWGFDEVARHDWAQIVEAGRAIGRFDSRRLDRRRRRAHRRGRDRRRRGRARRIASWPSPTGSRRPRVWRVSGGHAVCTLSPERFVPALVAACAAVVRSIGHGRRRLNGRPAGLRSRRCSICPSPIRGS